MLIDWPGDEENSDLLSTCEEETAVPPPLAPTDIWVNHMSKWLALRLTYAHRLPRICQHRQRVPWRVQWILAEKARVPF